MRHSFKQLIVAVLLLAAVGIAAALYRTSEQIVKQTKDETSSLAPTSANLIFDKLMAEGDKIVILAGATSTLEVSLARTEEERERGLSGRKSLNSNQGLLFIFPEPGIYGFWMKEMNFPIDIIWLDASSTVVSINHDVAPDSYPTVFYPPTKIQYVLETNAGWANKNSFKTGDQLEALE